MSQDISYLFVQQLLLLLLWYLQRLQEEHSRHIYEIFVVLGIHEYVSSCLERQKGVLDCRIQDGRSCVVPSWYGIRVISLEKAFVSW